MRTRCKNLKFHRWVRTNTVCQPVSSAVSPLFIFSWKTGDLFWSSLYHCLFFSFHLSTSPLFSACCYVAKAAPLVGPIFCGASFCGAPVWTCWKWLNPPLYPKLYTLPCTFAMHRDSRTLDLQIVPTSVFNMCPPLSVLTTVHNFSKQYNTEKFS